MSRYLVGADAIGALSVPLASAASKGDRALVIRVKDPAAVISKQGGAAGEQLFKIAPETLTTKIYSSMQGEFAKALKEKGVDADVELTYTPPVGGKQPSDFVSGAVIGGGVALGIGWLFRLLLKKRG